MVEKKNRPKPYREVFWCLLFFAFTPAEALTL